MSSRRYPSCQLGAAAELAEELAARGVHPALPGADARIEGGAYQVFPCLGVALEVGASLEDRVELAVALDPAAPVGLALVEETVVGLVHGPADRIVARLRVGRLEEAADEPGSIAFLGHARDFCPDRGPRPFPVLAAFVEVGGGSLPVRQDGALSKACQLEPGIPVLLGVGPRQVDLEVLALEAREEGGVIAGRGGEGDEEQDGGGKAAEEGFFHRSDPFCSVFCSKATNALRDDSCARFGI
jgi:hypothetical protein